MSLISSAVECGFPGSDNGWFSVNSDEGWLWSAVWSGVTMLGEMVYCVWGRNCLWRYRRGFGRDLEFVRLWGNGWVFEKNCRLLGCAMFCLVVLDIPLFSGIFPVWNGVSV